MYTTELQKSAKIQNLEDPELLELANGAIGHREHLSGLGRENPTNFIRFLP